MQQELKPSTSQLIHFQEVFRKCLHHMKENKCRVFNYLLVLFSMCARIYEGCGKSLSFQLLWYVEEVHVSHLIAIRRMSKTLSNQPTVRLIMHAGTTRVMLVLDEINQNSGHVPIGHLIITIFY